MTYENRNAAPITESGASGNINYIAQSDVHADENPQLCGNVLARVTLRLLAAAYGEDAEAALPAEAIYPAQALALRTLACVAALPVGPFLFTTDDGGIRAMLDVAGPLGLATTAQCYAPTAMPASCQRIGTPPVCRQYAADHLASQMTDSEKTTLAALAEDLNHVAGEITKRHATLSQTAAIADTVTIASPVWAPWVTIAAQLEGTVNA